MESAPQEVNPRSRLVAMQQRVDLGDVTDDWLDELLVRSPLERLSAQVLQVRYGGKSAMQDLLFVEVKQVAHGLERYLSTLGSMAAITPLLGLLGTVIGMIKVFSAIQAAGWGGLAACRRYIRSARDNSCGTECRNPSPLYAPIPFKTG